MATQKQQLLDKEWEFHDVGGRFSHGIMVSPALSVHDDWMDCIEWDEYLQKPSSYDLRYLEALLSSPVFAGDNDWSNDIIVLEE